MTVDNLKPIVIKPKAKKRASRRELKRVAKVGGYTVFDGARAGKTFATQEEATAYVAEQLIRTGELYDMAPTDRHVTHTFKPSEQKESK